MRDVTVAYHRKPVLLKRNARYTGRRPGWLGWSQRRGQEHFAKSRSGYGAAISGQVMIFGQPYPYSRGRLAYVPQRESVDWDFPATALDVVLMGTYGRLGWFRRVGKMEREQALAALAQMEIDHLAKRQISQLSGGQQQRTFLARALVQQADLYLMDERLPRLMQPPRKRSCS